MSTRPDPDSYCQGHELVAWQWRHPGCAQIQQELFCLLPHCHCPHSCHMLCTKVAHFSCQPGQWLCRCPSAVPLGTWPCWPRKSWCQAAQRPSLVIFLTTLFLYMWLLSALHPIWISTRQWWRGSIMLLVGLPVFPFCHLGLRSQWVIVLVSLVRKIGKKWWCRWM